jgi:hypothetical protein
MRFLLRSLLLGSAAAGLAAQIPPGRLVVATELPSPPRTRLLAVDPANGAITPLGGFARDASRPFAVGFDPIAGHVLVALEAAGGGSTLVRLALAGTAVTFERELASLPGRATGIAVAFDGDVVVGTFGNLGGLWRVPRNGGSAVPLRPGFPTTAIGGASLAPYAFVAHVEASVPALSLIDLATGARLLGPAPVPALAGAVVTGVEDLPTGLIRQVVSDDQGRLHLFEQLSQLRAIPLQPPLPPGGTTALRLAGSGFEAYVLGDAAHPHLILAAIFGGGMGSWRTVAGPLPGSPVDFAFGPSPGPAALRFFTPCGGPTWTSVGEPRLGTTFTFGVTGAPASAPAAMLLGFSDQAAFGIPLPALLFGCFLAVSPDLTFPALTSPQGLATRPIAVPPLPPLAGTIFFGQWLAFVAPDMFSSDGAALHLAF